MFSSKPYSDTGGSKMVLMATTAAGPAAATAGLAAAGAGPVASQKNNKHV